MATTHIKNLIMLTLDETGMILNDADLVVDNGRIAHLGTAPQGIGQMR